ncbi:DeoR family transcriptional regulator [Streptomyces scabiei]|nr:MULTISPECIES: DeoR family transcriptional regulator [Streptomyces]MBP5875684.1 DeoR family transcriptional regulator [Streptomyces sp. LBUM 1477]MDX2652141.1 DeoR family transcriptional regulator [Streptomyces scabiei]MDX2725833.1 DeoR family transcriptional regulator [Streptomyces scabiei]MDX2863952.1 DeoR family transcriptional regulator [Streptomyces scabiei]MDX2881876.1 DeoR family transcriptional regulator [Streptomyces scabiei]
MPAPLTIAARRAMVAELVRQEPDISARNIAARLGVGKDTIRRDLDANATAQRQTQPDPAAPEATSAPDAPPSAPDGAPASAPDAPPAAPADADRLTVDLDDQLRADLATMTRTGMTSWDAIATAVSIVAGTYRNAWASGRIPDGVAPRILTCNIAPHREEESRP